MRQSRRQYRLLLLLDGVVAEMTGAGIDEASAIVGGVVVDDDDDDDKEEEETGGLSG